MSRRREDDLFKNLSYDEMIDAKHRRNNEKQKRLARLIGENFATFGLLAVMVLMVGSIWTELSWFTSIGRLTSEAFTTVILYILADFYASSIGAQGGKLDNEYIKNHNEYLALRDRVRAAGTVLLDVFCDWQIDIEYEYYLRRRCKELKIDYNEYVEIYSNKTLSELKCMFPMEDIKRKKLKEQAVGTYHNIQTLSKAEKIFQLTQIKHIELTPEILLTDGKVHNTRGGVSMSGEEYVEKHTIGARHIFITTVFAIIAAIPVFTLSQEFTLGMLFYTIFKIALLIYRMWSGYSRGAKGYNSIDPKHLQDKVKYLYLYLEFLDKRIYEELGDKYNVVGVGKRVEIETELTE